MGHMLIYVTALAFLTLAAMAALLLKFQRVLRTAYIVGMMQREQTALAESLSALVSPDPSTRVRDDEIQLALATNQKQIVDQTWRIAAISLGTMRARKYRAIRGDAGEILIASISLIWQLFARCPIEKRIHGKWPGIPRVQARAAVELYCEMMSSFANVRDALGS